MKMWLVFDFNYIHNAAEIVRKKIGKRNHPKKAFSIFRTIGTICSFFNPE